MSRKSTSRRENRRIDNKKNRAAVRQILDGGHPTQPQHMNWTSRADPIPVLDEGPRRHSGRPRKGCPKRKGGGKHVPVVTYYTRGSGEWVRTYTRTVCKFCGKHGWRRSKRTWEEPVSLVPTRAHDYDHWSYPNIMARLRGDLCTCNECMERLDAETKP